MVNKFKKLIRLLFNILKLNKSIILLTIPKSGTNYLRLILSNYFINIDSLSSEFIYVNYDDMNSYFPFNKNDAFNTNNVFYSKEDGIPKIFQKKYHTFCYDHLHYQHILFHLNISDLHQIVSGKRNILLYRNPLDYLISTYHYNYLNRTTNIQLEINNILDEAMQIYIVGYKQIQILIKKQNFIVKSYEELMIEPVKLIKEIITFLEIPMRDDLVKFSINSNSKDHIRKYEKKRKSPIHSPKGSSKSFVRSGEIGQWLDYLTEEEISTIFSKLKTNEINANHFTFVNPNDQKYDYKSKIIDRCYKRIYI